MCTAQVNGKMMSLIAYCIVGIYMPTVYAVNNGYINFGTATNASVFANLNISMENPIGSITFYYPNDTEGFAAILNQTTSILIAPRQGYTWPGLAAVELTTAQGGNTFTQALNGGMTGHVFYISVGSIATITGQLRSDCNIYMLVDYVSEILIKHDCATSAAFSFKHTYNVVGSYNLMVDESNFANAQLASTTMYVEYALNGFTLSGSDRVLTVGENAVFEITVDNVNTPIADFKAFLTCINTSEAHHNISTSTNLICIYDSPGLYVATLNLSDAFNNVEKKRLEFSVNDECTIPLVEYYKVGETPRICNPQMGFNYTINYGQGIVVSDGPEHGLITVPSDLNYSHGIYLISMVATRFLTIQQNYTVIYEHPIHNSTLTHDIEGVVFVPPGIVNFKVDSTKGLDFPAPTNVTCRFFDEGGEFLINVDTSTISVTGSRWFQFTHEFTKGGPSTVYLNCWNMVSSINISTTLTARDFAAADVNVTYPYAIPMNGTESTELDITYTITGLSFPPPGLTSTVGFKSTSSRTKNMTTLMDTLTCPNRNNYNLEIGFQYYSSSYSYSFFVKAGILAFIKTTAVDKGIRGETKFDFQITCYRVGENIDVTINWDDGMADDVLSFPAGSAPFLSSPIQGVNKIVSHVFGTPKYVSPKLTAVASNGVEVLDLGGPILIQNIITDINININTQYPYNKSITSTFNVMGNFFPLDNIQCSFNLSSGSSWGSVISFASSSSQENITIPPNDNTGNYQLSVQCENQLSSKIKISNYEIVCFSSAYLFGELHRTKQTAMKVFFDAQQLITGRISEPCINASKLNYDWKIVTEIGSALTFTQPNIYRITIQDVIPESGIYKISLKVTLPVNRDQFLEDFIWIEIISNPIVAKITGGTERSTGKGNLVTLDAKSLSYDPNIGYGHTDPDLLFEWKCYVVTDQSALSVYLNPAYNETDYRSRPECAASLESQGKITMNTTNLDIDTWALLEVTVKKGKRCSTSLQSVQISAIPPPDTEILCKLNCQQKVVPDNEYILKLTVKCPECSSTQMAEISYLWKILKYDSVAKTDVNQKWSSYYISTETANYFGAMVNAFEEGEIYLVKVDVFIPSRPKGSTSLRFRTNSRPYGGTCSIVPETGRAVLDDFQVVCTGWKDEGIRNEKNAILDASEPVTYRAIQTLGTEQLTVSSGIEQISPKFKLPLCPEIDDFNCPMKILISDAMLFATSVTLKVKVTSPIAESTPSTVNGSIAEPTADAKIKSIELLSENANQDMQDKTPTEQALISSTVASVLNDVEVEVSIVDKIVLAEVNDSATVSDDLINSFKTFDPINEQLGQSLESLMKRSFSSVDEAAVNGSIQPTDILKFASSVAISVPKPDIVTEKTQEYITNMATKLMDELLSNSVKSLKQEDIWQAFVAVNSLQDNIVNIAAPELPGEDEEFVEKSIEDEKGLTSQELNYFQKFKNRKKLVNARKRVRQAKKNVNQVSDMWQKSFTLMKMFSNPSTPKVLEQKSYSLKLEKTTLKTMYERMTNTSNYQNGVHIVMQGILLDNGTKITAKTVILKKNIYIHGANSHRVTGPVARSSINLDTESDTETFVVPKIQKTSFKDPQALTFKLVKPTFITGDASKMFYQKTLCRSNGEHICLLIRPQRNSLSYGIFWRSLIPPTDGEYDFKHTNVELGSDGKTMVACLKPKNIKRTGVMYIGLRPILLDGVIGSSRKRRAVDNTTVGEPDDLTIPFSISIQSFSCLSWNGVKEDWDDDKCEVEKDLLNGVTSCLCPGEPNSITASSFFVPPNTIDFSTVFSKFDIQSQAAVLGVIITILVIGIIFALWGRWKDSVDILQWGVTVLEDNFSEDKYYYLLTVYTGFVREGSTMSNVNFNLYGEEESTDVRELSDGVRKGFEAGSVMHFLMAVPERLGNLQYLRIWHDNSGKGKYASWYLNRIEVVDIQLNESFVFMSNAWLSIEDSTIDRVVPECGNECMKNFKTLFFEHARGHITDDHVWLSVLFRPVKSHFTRIQRVGCCMALLFLSMISNAMFFDTGSGKERERTSEIELGPIKFNSGQIYISFVSAIITAIPVFAIMILFRKSKLKTSKRKRSIPQWLPNVIKQQLEFSQKLEDILVIPDNIALKDAILPSWCIYIGWFLVFAASITSTFFLILFSMEWGKDLSEEWLTTFFLCFFESIILVDPFKVFFLAIIAGILLKTLTISRPTKYNMDEIMEFTTKNGKVKVERRKINMQQPISDKDFQFTKERKLRDTRMKNSIKELVFNIICLAVLSFILYSNRDTQSYSLHRYISRHFLEPPKGYRKYDTISQTSQYFTWLNETVLTALFPENGYNGIRMTATQRLFAYDSSNLRVGPPRLRQVRSVSENYSIPIVGEVYKIPQYLWTEEDTGQYCPNWKSQPCSDTDELQLTIDSWKFTSATDIWGLPINGLIGLYGGGGFIANLDVNKQVSSESLKEIFDQRWIDRYTRAVFFEFTLYNIDVNIFAYVSILTEFPATGGVVTYKNIFPFRPSQHVGNMGVFIIVCEAVFLFYVVISIVIMVIKIAKQRLTFFKQFWNVVETVMMGVAVAAMVLFIIRDQYTNAALDAYKQNDRAFVNFYHIVVWDYAFIYVLGILVTIATLRLMKCLAYTRMTEKVFNVLSESMTVFPGFVTFILISLISFACVGYVLFGRTSKFYMSFIASLETLFVGLLGDATFKNTNAEVAMAPFETVYFCVFVIFVTILLTNLFIAILMDVMNKAQVHTSVRKELDMNMFGYMWESVGAIITGKRSDYTYCQKCPESIFTDNISTTPAKTELKSCSFETKIQHSDNSDKATNTSIYHKLSVLSYETKKATL